jgi:hypothetical protein
MYHHFFHPENSGNNNLFNVILTAASAFAAFTSAYFAHQSNKQNKWSQIPVLEPEITDVENPHLLRLAIKNIGNGLAKNIKIKLSYIEHEIPFGTDLLPRKFQDFKMITLDLDVPFQGGNNPLFQNGELLVTYEDIYGEKYSVNALFKPDVTSQRKVLGHIDKNFTGYFYS